MHCFCPSGTSDGCTRPSRTRTPPLLLLCLLQSRTSVDGTPWCLGLRTKRRPAGNWPDGPGASRAPCWKGQLGGASFDTPRNLMTTGPTSQKKRPRPTPCTRLSRLTPSPPIAQDGQAPQPACYRGRAGGPWSMSARRVRPITLAACATCWDSRPPCAASSRGWADDSHDARSARIGAGSARTDARTDTAPCQRLAVEARLLVGREALAGRVG
jgi:hypothetical protein